MHRRTTLLTPLPGTTQTRWGFPFLPTQPDFAALPSAPGLVFSPISGFCSVLVGQRILSRWKVLLHAIFNPMLLWVPFISGSQGMLFLSGTGVGETSLPKTSFTCPKPPSAHIFHRTPWMSSSLVGLLPWSSLPSAWWHSGLVCQRKGAAKKREQGWVLAPPWAGAGTCPILNSPVPAGGENIELEEKGGGGSSWTTGHRGYFTGWKSKALPSGPCGEPVEDNRRNPTGSPAAWLSPEAEAAWLGLQGALQDPKTSSLPAQHPHPAGRASSSSSYHMLRATPDFSWFLPPWKVI